jgi:hypothetical protein
VKFELGAIPFTLPRVRMPVLTSEYIRAPLAVGCRGFVIPADAYLGGMSGLGGGTATLSGAISFTNANNATFYTSAGNAIALSLPAYLTTARASTDAVGLATALTASDTFTYGTINMQGPLQFNGNVNLGSTTFGGNILVNGNMKTNGIIRCSPYNGLGWSTELTNVTPVNCFADPCMTYLIYLAKQSTGDQTVNLAPGQQGQKVVIIQRNVSANALIVASGATPTFINKLTASSPLVIPPQHTVTLMFLGGTNLPGLGARANTWQVLTYI